jgi:glycine cleavage system T protein
MSTADSLGDPRPRPAESGRYWDLFLGTDIGLVDPDLDDIIGYEEERQARKLIMIPSESMAPKAVRQALGSVFNNVYAEGYPPLRMTREDEETLLDISYELANYRRYADRRFYKGVDYVHFVETLAQRRAADCFANELAGSHDIYVNVQPLSGAAANLAVYDTLLDVGDTVMGMNLYQGGHLTHGSEFNFSGKRYKVASYGVSKTTGRLDYDEIRDLARTRRPRMIIAGFTSYTWAPDWQAFADIAHEVGARLVADVSHPAGMIVAGAFPSPVGVADVITFTTHKTLCGPRGAVIMCTDEDLARRIDLAVFPGEQGGPHPQKFAAMAVMFKIAQTEAFRQLQWQIKANAAALAEGLRRRGLKLAYGGTDSHFCMLDLNGLASKADRKASPLRGEPAVRILDLAGIVANKNTIPGDSVTALAMGIRLGTPWLTQRSFTEAEIDQVAGLIHKIVTNIHPFSYAGLAGELPRGKIDLEILEEVKAQVEVMANRGAAETENKNSGYPHFYAELATQAAPSAGPVVNSTRDEGEGLAAFHGGAALVDASECGLLLVTGERATPALAQILTSDVAALKPGQCQSAFLLDSTSHVIDDVFLSRLGPDARGQDRYLVRTQSENHARVAAWLRALGDGYIVFDEDDLYRKVEGPLVVQDLSDPEPQGRYVALILHGPETMPVLSRALTRGHDAAILRGDMREHAELAVPVSQAPSVFNALVVAGATPASAEALNAVRAEWNRPDYGSYASYGSGSGRPTGPELFQRCGPELFELRKPFFIGCRSLDAMRQRPALPEFRWEESPGAALKRTPLHEWHKAHTRHIVPFASWEMPVWYSGVLDEHNAIRKAAGLFDVAHMGVFEISGPHSAEFLDLVCTNYVRWYAPGESFYSYFLDIDGKAIDDLLVYRRAPERFLLVVNASNADKDWAWLNAVNNGEILIDRERPDICVLRPATIRDLKDASSGPDMRIDLALQGPASMRILQSLASDPRLSALLGRVRKTGLIECNLAGFDLIIARTGYTGEDVGYEIFVHPQQALAFWEVLLNAGRPFGLQPAGLAARDSTRTEAGLPLYGHELDGPYDISPAGAGFPGYVKLHKPYFIGRNAYLAQEKARAMEVIRFRMGRRGVRMPKTGDPLLNDRGQAIGWVTSAAVDVDGVILGLAYVQSRHARPGDEIGIINLPLKPFAEKPDKAALEPGDKIQLPDAATILRRFPDAGERAHWRGSAAASASSQSATAE